MYELPGSAQSAVFIVLLSLLTLTFGGAVCLHGYTRRRTKHLKSLHGKSIESAGEDGAYTEVVAVEMNGDIANGRLVSHDRALPEIPASASGVASTDDDEEEDEGHYDVISKSRRAAVAATVSANSRTQKPHFCHPYEIVAGDSDSTYAGIREELEAVISHRNSRGRASNPSSIATTAAAGGLSDPPYAGIVGNSNKDAQTSAPGVSYRPRVPSTHSTVVTNPQLQRLHVADHVEPDRTSSVVVRADNDVESPLLPPRNGNIDSVDGGPLSMATCSLSTTWSPLSDAVSAVAVSSSANIPASSASAACSDPGMQLHDQLQLLHVSAGGDAVPVSAVAAASVPVVTERVANYSSVTARESLENLRRRQQQERLRRCTAGLLMSDDIDTTYDTIDYDVINSFAVGNCASSRAAAAAADNSIVYNNGSDLYAEIGTGPSSAQSSTTYAKVSDLTIDHNTTAATDHLMHLSTPDDVAGDSYSQVDDVTTLMVTAAMQITHPPPSAVYSVVSRNRTASSQTEPVTATTSDSSNPAVTDAVTVDTRRDLYTRVVRRRDGQRPATSEPATRVNVSADGYASIDEAPVATPRQSQEQNYSNGSVDFYDVIRDDLSVTASSDFDPNYESVPQTTAGRGLTSASQTTAGRGSASASNSVNCIARSSSAAAVQHRPPDARATVSVVSSADTGRQNASMTRHQRGGFVIREHIYDEVSSPTTTSSTNNMHTDV